MKENSITVVLREKKDLLLQLQELDKTIKCLMAEESIEALGEKLEYRQKKIEELGALEIKYSSEDILESNAQDLVEEIELIISDIIKADEENRSLAKETLNKFRGQIKSLNESKKKMGSYTQAGIYSDGYFVDAKK